MDYVGRSTMLDVADEAQRTAKEKFEAGDREPWVHTYLMGIEEALRWAAGAEATPNLAGIVSRAEERADALAQGDANDDGDGDYPDSES